MTDVTALVVSALPGELTGLHKRLEGGELFEVAGQSIRSGRLAGWLLWSAACGVGGGQATTRLEALLRHCAPRRLIGVGVAGGLSPGLRVGQVVRVERVLSEKSLAGFEDDLLESSVSLTESPVRPTAAVALTTEAIVGSVEAKKHLASRVTRVLASRDGRERDTEPGMEPDRERHQEPAVVDLESWHWARTALSQGLGWSIFRAVSDGAHEELPLDFERFRDEQGQIDQASIARAVSLRPWLWGSLGRLAVRMRRCSESLASAVEDSLESEVSTGHL